VSVLVVCALALVLPPAAGAQETNAPPGNSAIDEYLETVPSASGNRPSAGPRSAQDDRPVPTAAARALRGRGAEGRAVAELVRSSPASRRDRGGGDAAGRPAPSPVAEPRGDSPLGSVARAVGGGGDAGGMGPVLPVILLGGLAALGAVLAVRLARRRSAS
jgi:hypothetical protein